MSSKNQAGPTSATNRRAQMRAEAEAAAQRARTRKIVITALSVVVVAVLVIGGLVLAQSRGKQSANGILPPNTTSAGNGIIVNPGKAEGKPVVELFFDYQCPGCGSLERSAGQYILGGAQKGDYQLIYRPMIFLDTNLRNDASLRAANAAACYAQAGGDYPAYHQLVFNNQPAKEGQGYTDDLLRNQLPSQLGMNGDQLTQFQKCFDAGTFKGFAQQTNTAAAKDGITSTPTVRVNGKNLDLSTMTAPDQFPDAVAKAAAAK
ncbi:DsbA family protein [Raineyella fluvialis]|uniref:Thioredoxin domain-containing protein n=1 Tax=Raineyella fluvialis TaxID=2662261 RepID=A0A5Q2FGS0_9ACTN|nr:thioredoxin domain-containing protein [Raineyella fluvialis]QGF24987.1 thioredoxin domain-containing protein [Raineyella fluvialis]